MAPESIGFRRYSHASDVWSFGVVMCKCLFRRIQCFFFLFVFFQVFEGFFFGFFSASLLDLKGETLEYGIVPYPNINPKDLLDYLERGNRMAAPTNITKYPTIYDWMLGCWSMDPLQRPKFSDCVGFFTKMVNLPMFETVPIRNIGELSKKTN